MEEGGLIGQLGINWKLFLSQAVNFFILLFILQKFVYKPLLAVIKKRNERIKEGLEKADAADKRLHEVDVIAKDRLKKAENDSVKIIKTTEEKAKQLEQSLRTKAEDHQKELLEQIKANAIKQGEESRQNVLKEAAELVKRVIAKTIELKPDAIDEALVEKAVSHIKKNEV